MRPHTSRRAPLWVWVLTLALLLVCTAPSWALGGPLDPVDPEPPLPTIGAVKESLRAPLVGGAVSKAAPSLSIAAETLPLESVADATVLEGRPTGNFGNTADMWVGYDESLEPYPQTARSLVRFDLAALPPDALVAKATLRLYLVNSWDYPNRERTVTAYRPAGDWVEGTVTWETAPAPAEAYGSAQVRHGDWRWHSFDVTELVRAWQAGVYPNHGIMLRAPEVSGDDSSRRGFATRETDYAPQLVIEYGILRPAAFLPLVVKIAPQAAPTATPTATQTLPPATATPTTTPVPSGIVYITQSGTRYHREGCHYLSGGATPVTCDWAIANGYTACSVCKPECP